MICFANTNKHPFKSCESVRRLHVTDWLNCLPASQWAWTRIRTKAHCRLNEILTVRDAFTNTRWNVAGPQIKDNDMAEKWMRRKELSSQGKFGFIDWWTYRQSDISAECSYPFLYLLTTSFHSLHSYSVFLPLSTLLADLYCSFQMSAWWTSNERDVCASVCIRHISV